MILGETSSRPTTGAQTTLDDLFVRAAARRPQAAALADPANRPSFTGGAPRRLTYAEADRMIGSIAGRLRRIGLAPDSIVAIQLPNSVESVLAFLGVLRAGMIAAPLPLLWRRADCVAALNRLGAKAIITAARIGATDHALLAMHVAAEVFPIKYVCCFGAALPDGLVPMDDLYDAEAAGPAPDWDRRGDPVDHLAVITWDVAADGAVPVARNHKELLAGGIAALFESGIGQDAAILSTLPAHSYAGIALTIVPWLLTGGTLALHQPFDPQIFAAQVSEHRCQLAVLPGPVVERLADAGLIDPQQGLRALLGAWRAPERLAAAGGWRNRDVSLVDVQIFGETGFVASRRLSNGKPAPLRAGIVSAARERDPATPVAEIARTEAGTIALRGPMVPRHAFPPGAERGNAPYLKVGELGFVDTGFTCRLDRESGHIAVTGPPAGIVSVGGYRFILRELQELIARVDQGRMLTALPDAFAGHRLAGNPKDHDTLRETLGNLGINPLVIRAFRDRPSLAASASRR